MLAVWTNQSRYLGYERIVHPRVQKVTSSLPQRDSWSVLATKHIREQFPNKILRTFVSPSAAEVLAIRDEWARWSRILAQLASVNSATCRLNRISTRRLLAWNCKVLFSAATRKRKKSGFKNICTFYHLLNKSRFLPLNWGDEQKIANGAILGKVTWFWAKSHGVGCLGTHQITSCSNFKLPCIVPLLKSREHARTCVQFFILRGHSLLVRVRLLQTNFRAAWRLAKRFIKPCTWSAKGWSKVIDTGLSYYGCNLVPPWEWHHDTLGNIKLHRVCQDPKEFDRIQHVLRESFRCYHFGAFLNSERREAKFVREQQPGLQYDEETCKRACRMADTRKKFHILSDATVSAAAYGVMNGSPVTTCPFCNLEEVPSVIHVAWECQGLNAIRAQHGVDAADVTNPLRRRHGWPGGLRCDQKVLDWSVLVRDRFLNHRYNH